MKLQFKQQQFQIDAVKAVVDCFDGQPIKTNRFTLERSREIVRQTKMAAQGIQEMDFANSKKSPLATPCDISLIACIIIF